MPTSSTASTLDRLSLLLTQFEKNQSRRGLKLRRITQYKNQSLFACTSDSSPRSHPSISGESSDYKASNPHSALAPVIQQIVKDPAPTHSANPLD
jgi:hypothetical protein